MNTISDLALGREGTISSITLSGRQRQHIEDLGFVPGTSVRPLMRSPSGDPTAYEVMGAVIALRREDARHILCNSAASCSDESRTQP